MKEPVPVFRVTGSTAPLDEEAPAAEEPTAGEAEQPAAFVLPAPAPGRFVVAGIVREHGSGRPLEGVDVRAYDKDLLSDDFLGAATTEYAAPVVKLYPQVNRQKGTLKVEVAIPEADEWLRPDTSVRITFLDQVTAGSGEAAAALVTAPRAALRTEAGDPYVWVVTDGRLRRQSVTLGRELGTQVVVEAGLVCGEARVTGDPVVDLLEGQSVRVANP